MEQVNKCRYVVYEVALHVMRREEEDVDKIVTVMDVSGKRWRGRAKRRWMDSIKHDLTEKGLSGMKAQDRATWRRLVRNINAT